jgi:hypothetical protein
MLIISASRHKESISRPWGCVKKLTPPWGWIMLTLWREEQILRAMPAVLGRPREALSYPLWWAVQRGAKLCTIGEGTSEIQRPVIARELIGG